MGTWITFIIPEFNCAIIWATYYYFFGVLDQFGDVGGVLGWKIADQVAVGYIPHFYGFVETCAQEGHVVVEE